MLGDAGRRQTAHSDNRHFRGREYISQKPYLSERQRASLYLCHELIIFHCLLYLLVVYIIFNNKQMAYETFLCKHLCPTSYCEYKDIDTFIMIKMYLCRVTNTRTRPQKVNGFIVLDSG